MYHMHVGLSTWSATEVALAEVYAALAESGPHGRSIRAGTRPGDGGARKRAPPRGQRDRPAHRPRRMAAARRGRADPAAPRRLHDRLPCRIPEHAARLVGRRHDDRQRRAVHRLRPARRLRRDSRHRGDRAGARRDRRAPRSRRARSFEPRGRLGDAGLAFRCVRRVGGARDVRGRGAHRGTIGALLRQHDPEAGVPSRRALRARRSARPRLDRLDDLRQHGRSSTRRPGPQHRGCHRAADVRHRPAAATPDRPRRQPGAAHRGGTDPELRRDRRGAPARPRDRTRGSQVTGPLRLVTPRTAGLDDRRLRHRVPRSGPRSPRQRWRRRRDAAQVLLALRRTSMAELEATRRSRRSRRGRSAGTLEGVARPPSRRSARQVDTRLDGNVSYSPSSKCTTSFAMRWPECCREQVPR